MEAIIGSQHEDDDDEDVVGGADADNAGDDESTEHVTHPHTMVTM